MGLSQGDYAKVSIIDNGEGIDEEIMEKIFDPFFTTKTAGNGKGLGLSTSHGLIKQHGGKITVESEIDKGSTFKVFFPLSTSSRKA